jgi:hypothetical protein
VRYGIGRSHAVGDVTHETESFLVELDRSLRGGGVRGSNRFGDRFRDDRVSGDNG